MTTATATKATDKQIAFLTKLSIERNTATAEDIAKLAEQGLDKHTASLMIDSLMKTRPTHNTKPATPKLPDVPAGHYALVNSNDHKTYFFKVDRPTEGRWAGYTFVKRLSGDNELRVDREESRHILAAISRDPLEAATRYGHETNSCGICHRRLTDETSRTLGIGPVCLKKFGDNAEDIAWDLAVARREAEQERAAYEEDLRNSNF